MPNNTGICEISALGYLVAQAADMTAWRAFGTDILGMQVVDANGGLAFRMDDRCQRILITPDLSNASHAIGWEVAGKAGFDRLVTRLRALNIAVRHEPEALARQRFVTALASFNDPMGNRLEIFYGPLQAATAFEPGRALSGFRTGALGLGHIVLTTPDVAAGIAFYRDVLGFRLSDFQTRPFGAYFMHINPRHHSLALIESDKNGIHHLMVELTMLDDVGQCYDLLVDEPGRVGVSMGRHSNDHMVSFYAHCPGGFMIEYGWGGRDIDPGTWQPVELDNGPSLWGHERSWLSAAGRAEAKSARLNAAKIGLRAPVNVLPGKFNICSENPDDI